MLSVTPNTGSASRGCARPRKANGTGAKPRKTSAENPGKRRPATALKLIFSRVIGTRSPFRTLAHNVRRRQGRAVAMWSAQLPSFKGRSTGPPWRATSPLRQTGRTPAFNPMGNPPAVPEDCQTLTIPEMASVIDIARWWSEAIVEKDRLENAPFSGSLSPSPPDAGFAHLVAIGRRPAGAWLNMGAVGRTTEFFAAA
jgi:hypothetical protein